VLTAEQVVESAHTLKKFGAHLGLIFRHGKPNQMETRGAVMRFERRPKEIDGGHVRIGLQVQHGGDAVAEAETFEVFDRPRMRADEQRGKNLCDIHSASGADVVTGWRNEV